MGLEIEIKTAKKGVAYGWLSKLACVDELLGTCPGLARGLPATCPVLAGYLIGYLSSLCSLSPGPHIVSGRAGKWHRPAGSGSYVAG